VIIARPGPDGIISGAGIDDYLTVYVVERIVARIDVVIGIPQRRYVEVRRNGLIEP